MKRLKSLVAEDNDSHFRLFREFLEDMGLDVEREAFGDAALDRMLHTDYDVVILDVELPKMNGREIIREVRKSKPYLPIIAVSAFAGVHGEAECLNLGADDYIEKRFNRDTFQARVRRAIWHGSVANEEKTAYCARATYSKATGKIVPNEKTGTCDLTINVTVDSDKNYKGTVIFKMKN